VALRFPLVTPVEGVYQYFTHCLSGTASRNKRNVVSYCCFAFSARGENAAGATRCPPPPPLPGPGRAARAACATARHRQRAPGTRPPPRPPRPRPDPCPREIPWVRSGPRSCAPGCAPPFSRLGPRNRGLLHCRALQRRAPTNESRPNREK